MEVLSVSLGSTVTFQWTAPADEGEFPISSYEVQYQRIDDNDDDDGNVKDAADWSDAISGEPTPPTKSLFEHKNAPGDSTFHYRVRAVNGSGPGPWAPAANETPQQQILFSRNLDKPVLTATLTGMTDILLQWNVPASNGATLDSFDLQVWVPNSNSPTAVPSQISISMMRWQTQTTIPLRPIRCSPTPGLPPARSSTTASMAIAENAGNELCLVCG